MCFGFYMILLHGLHCNLAIEHARSCLEDHPADHNWLVTGVSSPTCERLWTRILLRRLTNQEILSNITLLRITIPQKKNNQDNPPGLETDSMTRIFLRWMILQVAVFDSPGFCRRTTRERCMWLYVVLDLFGEQCDFSDNQRFTYAIFGQYDQLKNMKNWSTLGSSWKF